MTHTPLSAARTSEKKASTEFELLIREIETLRAELYAEETTFHSQITALHPVNQASARNLLHYLALRRRDIRPLQERLASLGLSSLGRAESHVLASLNTVLNVLHRLAVSSPDRQSLSDVSVGFAEGHTLLEQHTVSLLGKNPSNRSVRIMVTMPSEAADDYQMVREMLLSGMNCMRVNCAHDSSDAWGRMIANLRRAERDLGRRCQVLMDLAGPKLRTGEIEPGPQVIKWRPRRDEYGHALASARIWLTPQESPQPSPAPSDASLPVPGEWLSTLEEGDTVRFVDARGARRKLKIVSLAGESRWAECRQTSYVSIGTRLTREPRHTRLTLDPLFEVESDPGDSPPHPEIHGVLDEMVAREALVGELPPKSQYLVLKPNDTLILTAEPIPGKPATLDKQGRLLTPAQIACTLPEIFTQVRVGERVLLDDGKIGGVIKAVNPQQIHIRITQAREAGERLRAEKGINLPDSALNLSALTEKDREDLRFVAANADLVGLSFVHSAEDVTLLQEQLAELGGKQPGIVIKVETRQAFENLPDLLLAAMRNPGAGVMIARGDLAVECGYERLAEVQEEILWICEAAHMPVIWATQVLETLAQTGLPSRAEITDAAMGVRAECVMLNKGPHILEAIRLLDGILQRMQAHTSKKAALLRQLRAWTKE